MKESTFIAMLNEVHDRLVALTKTKGDEYRAGDEDQLANFNRLAEQLGLRREQVWQVLFTKHLDAIRNYIRTQKQGSEPIVGRIDDAILYLCLLRGMVTEEPEIDIPDFLRTVEPPMPGDTLMLFSKRWRVLEIVDDPMHGDRLTVQRADPPGPRHDNCRPVTVAREVTHRVGDVSKTVRTERQYGRRAGKTDAAGSLMAEVGTRVAPPGASSRRTPRGGARRG